MNTSKVTKYESALRADQSRMTRERILDGVRILFERDPQAAFSVDEVSEVSGVNRRTIFRHFPTKDALLQEFWARTNASLGVRFWPESIGDLTAMPPDLFEALEGIEGIVRASHASGAGHEMRLKANDERVAAFRSSLKPLMERLDPLRARQLEAVVQLLFSATAWMTMKDYWGLNGREAGEAAAWAIGALLEAADEEAKGATQRTKR